MLLNAVDSTSRCLQRQFAHEGFSPTRWEEMAANHSMWRFTIKRGARQGEADLKGECEEKRQQRHQSRTATATDHIPTLQLMWTLIGIGIGIFIEKYGKNIQVSVDENPGGLVGLIPLLLPSGRYSHGKSCWAELWLCERFQSFYSSNCLKV